MNSQINIEEHASFFQQLMLDILQRRALFRAFESSITGKNILNNFFISFYATDYIRSQLTDLRKFFETESKSYKLSSLTNCLVDKTIKNIHTNIFETKWKTDLSWNVSLEDLANKAVMHKEINYISSQLYKVQLDLFIDTMNDFLDKLISALSSENHKVSLIGRSLDSDFLKNQQEKDFEEYLRIAST